MSEQPINLRPVPPSSSSKAGVKPIPTPSLLKPWTFDYSRSPDGKDLNLLIMFHGLGDSKTPFAKLGKSLNLPSTSVLSLQAPLVVPFLESPNHWSWYNTFDPLFNPLPSPDPSAVLPHLRSLLSALTSDEVGWDLTQIHLFGWGQGGTTALELAHSVGRDPLSSPSFSREPRKRLGSTVSVCAGLLSFPSADLNLETPILYFTRQSAGSAVQSKSVNTLKRAFREVRVVQADPRGGEGMPGGREEWEGIMRFWGEVLGREEMWRGGGVVFEVVR